jgi:TolB protein
VNGTLTTEHCLLYTVYCLLLTAILASCGPRLTPTPTQLADVPSTPTQIPIVTATQTPVPNPGGGILLLSMTESGTAHLFAFSPSTLTLTRLTADPWDDVAPSLSPDGSRLAYASRRNGYWNLYILTLQTGDVFRLTDTPGYESAPSWAPDGQWLVYESYADGNLELYVRSTTDPAQAPYRLTNSPAADSSPAWIPTMPGRKVAFVSNRAGQDDVWLADLDRAGDDSYTNLSNTPAARESHPVWSADGNRIAWASTDANGMTGIYVYDTRTPETPPRWAGAGSWPIWQDSNHIITAVFSPNQTLLTGFTLPGGDLTLALTPLPGTLRGIVYLPGGLPGPLPASFQSAAAQTPAPLYTLVSPPRTDIPSGRAALVPLEGVQAPYPQLHDAVAGSFQALRQRAASAVGWDALASLGNAWVPFTTPLDPGLGDDWLYTGRAFALNPLLANAGWIAAVREDNGGQTYWRLYLRTLALDGSQGEPLHTAPWDFKARYAGDPGLYDQGGGTMGPIPSGYWFDLTALAVEYGWQRLPALANWRSYYAGARFTEFAMTQGLDWRTAMLELYPPESLVTPTIVIPPTRTPTPTPWGYRTPIPSLTPTPRPTSTP